MSPRIDRRAHAERAIEIARAATGRRLLTKVIEAGERTGVLIGIVDEDMSEARRLHEALIDACERELLDVDVIVVAGEDES
jgi:hypothetical protein